MIDRRRFLAGALGLVGTSVLGACQDRPATGPAAPAGRRGLRLPGGLWGFPSPFAYLAGPGYVRMSLIYDTLLWRDATGRLRPWLARDVHQSPDRLTYTFQLRDDVRWHDGTPFTAEDVAFTFRYFGQQTLSFAVIADRPEEVVDVQPLGPRQVQVRLSSPRVTFPDAAGSLPIVPEHVWSSIPDAPKAQDQKVLIGTGPYRLTDYSQGEGFYLYSANDDHFLGRPAVERIEMQMVDDPPAAVLAGLLDAGETRQTGVTSDVLGPFRSDPRFGLLSDTGPMTVALYWNLGRGGALGDLRFRRACAHAIDRPGMVDRLLEDNGQPGNPGFFPPGHPFRVPVEQYPFDMGRAERLLAEAGYPQDAGGRRHAPDGTPLRFSLLVPGGLPPVVDLLVGTFRDLGVEVSVQPLDTPSLFARMTGGDYELAIVGYGGLNSDPDYLRRLCSSRVEQRFFHSAQGYADPEFDRLAARQLVTADEAERRQLLARMQQIVARDLPFLHLYYPTQFHLFRPAAFDSWYYTPEGIGPGVPSVYNKHALMAATAPGRPTPASRKEPT